MIYHVVRYKLVYLSPEDVDVDVYLISSHKTREDAHEAMISHSEWEMDKESFVIEEENEDERYHSG